jgi:hypothetical protein
MAASAVLGEVSSEISSSAQAEAAGKAAASAMARMVGLKMDCVLMIPLLDQRKKRKGPLDVALLGLLLPCTLVWQLAQPRAWA